MLRDEVLSYIDSCVEAWESEKDCLLDVINHGCQSGVVPFLVYYTDTISFYKRNSKEISTLLAELLQETGYDSIANLLPAFESSDPLCLEDQNQNLLARFGFEQICYQIYLEKGYV